MKRKSPGTRETTEKLTRGTAVGAVVSAMHLLRYISAQPAPVTLSQCIREVGLNPSTCFNLLRTLVAERMLSFDPTRKLYEMGHGVLDLAQRAGGLAQDLGVVRPILESVAAEHEVTVTLWRRISADRMSVVLAAVSPGMFRVQLEVGHRLPLLLGSGGRVMAAYSGLTQVEMRAQFARLRWSRPLSFRKYLIQVNHVKEKGWSLDAGDFVAAVASVSVPVFDREGRFLLACGATMFLHRYNAELERCLAADLARASRAMTERLGGGR